MKYQEVFILLPCHSLEDFPIHYDGDDAEGLLANWSAMWHPALVAATGATPGWHRVDNPPGTLSERLILIPSVSQSELPTGFVQRADEEGARVVRGKKVRGEIVADALAALDGGDGGVEPDLAADFLALGYCYLQIQLLTRQMRYSSNLDEPHFGRQVLAAAEAAVRGDAEEARKKLSSCFDLLGEERDHYYSVDAYLLDLTMVAPSTIGAPLRDELQSSAPVNLLLAGEVLQQMEREETQSLAALKQALEQSRAAVIGGEVTERALPLLGMESILGEMRRGLAVYEQILGRRPKVFGRRRFGLTPNLPQVLHKLGFDGVLHATLDDGRFPEGSQVKTRWEGADGTVIDAVARAPLDASKPATYLSLAVKLGESMDRDHVATLCLAHWPGAASVWYGDLRRIARYGGMLGKFLTAEEYFRATDLPGNLDRFDADKYRSPYLKQAVIRGQTDLVSTSIRYWRRTSQLIAARALCTMTWLARGGDISESLRQIDQLVEQSNTASESPDTAPLDEQVAAMFTQAAERMADALPRSQGAAEAGCLVINPHSFVRRVTMETTEFSRPPAVEPPIYAVDEEHARRAVADAPPLGFLWVTGGGQASRKRRPAPPIAEENVLRNEFLEAIVNPTLGSLQSIHDYKTRGNRISQQLALRWMGQDGKASYSIMTADKLTATSDAVAGVIDVAGRLVDRRGKLLAKYRQSYRLDRGSRVLFIDIELDPTTDLKADPWNSYYGCRFAWADEAADLWRAVCGARQPASAKRLEAPLYLEIENGQVRTTIFTGGIPFHRRSGMRMLDSLLIARGERERKFRIGIGVETPQPLQEALALLAPPPVIQRTAPPLAGASSGWLAHIDAKNVLVTYLAPLADGGGLRLRLLEVAGRSVRATLSCCRALSSARLVDFLGAPRDEVRVENGRARIEMSAHEFVELEARWADPVGA